MNPLEKAQATALKRRGRPPSFNRDEALEKAMQTFWTYGYEGTSMAALIDAMQMNKPSIYAAFGNKEALFNKALDQYAAGPSTFVKKALSEPTAFLVVKTFLTKAVELLADRDNPRGCLIVQGALSCGPEAKAIQDQLIAYRASTEEQFNQRFALAKTKADLPADSNTAALAKYVATIHQGISVQAASGASRESLMEVVEMVMQNWPPRTQ